MTRAKTQRDALSVGQLASRWAVSVERIKRLVQTGQLPGAFKVPSAGKFGEAVRIPLSTVLQAEENWAIAGHGEERTRLRARRRNDSRKLVNFPELSLEGDGGCHEDGPR
mgnify:CR=1 FL=1